MNSAHLFPKNEDAKKDKARSARLRQWGLPVLAVAIIAVLAAGLKIAGFWPGSGLEAASPSAGQTAGGLVTYPQSLFADGKARHFKHVDGGSEIRYFILRSSDGMIRAAFDACDVCWPENKGYAQNGDVMVCRNCGQRFSSLRINEVKGGCNPAPLTRTVENDQVKIRVADILDGAGYFNFAGRR